MGYTTESRVLVSESIDARHVASAAGPDALHWRRLGENAFGEQDADGQLEVVAGRTHGDRDGAMHSSSVDVAPQANLQRLLDRRLVSRGVRRERNRDEQRDAHRCHSQTAHAGGPPCLASVAARSTIPMPALMRSQQETPETTGELSVELSTHLPSSRQHRLPPCATHTPG